MRKLIPLLIIGIFLISIVGAVATPEHTSYEKENIQLHFSTLSVQQQGEQIIIELDQANSYLIKENKPLLPLYTHTFTYPAGTTIKSIICTPVDIQEQTITGKIISSPLAIPINSITKGENIQQPGYSLNEIYPTNWYNYDIGRGINHGQPTMFVKLDFTPVRYNPEKNTIQWPNKVDIEIEFETKSVNFEDEYNLIILTADEFEDELQTLATHKNNRDIQTKLVTLSDIYDGTYFPAQGRDEPEKIKYFIKNAYDNWGVSNVMLVGGDNEFPTRDTHVRVSNDDDEIFVSDLYYADLYDGENQFISWDSNDNDLFAEYKWNGNTDDIDFYPDVNLGRLACTDSQEVNTVVQKIKTYENNRAYTKNWFNEIVVIGGDTVPGEYGDKSGIDEGELVNQEIVDIMDGFIPTKIWDSNGKLGGIIPTGKENIDTALNSGCGFVDFSGHGAPWIWTTFPHNGTKQSLPTPLGRYTNGYIEDLNNGDELPIAMCGGCSLGKYPSNDNCFAWSYLSNPNGGGIASFGATALGYVYLGQYVTYGLVEGLTIKIFKAFDQGAKSFGEMWSGGLNYYISPGMEGGDWKTLMEWQPFGDPTLALSEESNPPAKPTTPNGPSSGSAGTKYTFTSSATDPDGDELYYLFDWGDGQFSTWIGPYDSGDTVQSSHTFNNRGTFQIRVKAKDEHGKLSEWSDPLSTTMPKNKIVNTHLLQFLKDHTHLLPILQILLQMLGL